jgi:hypothetical protein
VASGHSPSGIHDHDNQTEPKTDNRSFSAILSELANDCARERIAVADLLQLMKDRAFGALIFVFAFPNIIPTPPGTSAILGIPLILLTAQLTLGQTPWLPKLIAERSVARADFATMIDKAAPWIIRAERLLRPRIPALSSRLAERLIGCFSLVLALVLALPIPLGNMLPALALCIMAFGILERDGLWVLAGVATGIVSMFLVAGVIYALIKSAIFLIATFLA